MKYESFCDVGLMFWTEETKYGTFFNAVVYDDHVSLEETTSQARNKDRAKAYALEKYARILIRDSFEK